MTVFAITRRWNIETMSEENYNFQTKQYALTEGPKRGRRELMWATRSAPLGHFMFFYGPGQRLFVLFKK